MINYFKAKIINKIKYRGREKDAARCRKGELEESQMAKKEG